MTVFDNLCFAKCEKRSLFVAIFVPASKLGAFKERKPGPDNNP